MSSECQKERNFLWATGVELLAGTFFARKTSVLQMFLLTFVTMVTVEEGSLYAYLAGV